MTLEEIQEENRSSFAELIQTMRDQDDAAFDTPLAEGKWSMRQQAEHICMTAGGILKSLGYSREKLRDRFGAPSGEERNYATILSAYESALGPKGVELPSQFSPAGDDSISKASQLEMVQNVADGFVTELSTRDDLSEYMIPHPIMGLHTLREMAIFNIIHNRHHLRYIKNYLAAKDVI